MTAMTAQKDDGIQAPVTLQQITDAMKAAKASMDAMGKPPEIRATITGEAILARHTDFVNLKENLFGLASVPVISKKKLALMAIVEAREFYPDGNIKSVISIGPMGSFKFSPEGMHPEVWKGILAAIEEADRDD